MGELTSHISHGYFLHVLGTECKNLSVGQVMYEVEHKTDCDIRHNHWDVKDLISGKEDGSIKSQ